VIFKENRKAAAHGLYSLLGWRLKVAKMPDEVKLIEHLG